MRKTALHAGPPAPAIGWGRPTGQRRQEASRRRRESLALPPMDTEAPKDVRSGPEAPVAGAGAPREPAETAAWLMRNAADCLPDRALARKLAEGRPLRVKLGIDPT